MRAKKCVSILVAASLATTMLTACPWEKEEDKTDDASSVPVTSTDTSQDDDSSDSGDDDSGQEEDKLTKENIEIKQTNGTVQVDSVNSGTTDTYTITFTATPKEKNHIASSVSVEGSTKDGSFSGSWSAAGNMAAFARASAVVTIKPDDDYETFTVTGIPADATSCTIDVTFADLGYVIESDVYKVHNADGLLAWNKAAQKDLSLSCTLTDNITLESNTAWTPIGNNSNRYTGTFDGDGYTISNVNIKTPSNNHIGLFGYVDGGTVENLNLEIANISGNYFVGGIAGYNDGTIQGCMVSGSVSGSHYVGGVVGYNYNGIIQGCMVSGRVSGSDCVGGVVGYNYDGTVEGCCFADDRVNGTDSSACVGGVVGFNYDHGTITACYWQAGTGGSPSKGVGNGNDDGNDGTTPVENGDWNSITDHAFTSRFTVDNTTGKPVPVNIKTSTGNTVVDTMLDTARVFGM